MQGVAAVPSVSSAPAAPRVWPIWALKEHHGVLVPRRGPREGAGLGGIVERGRGGVGADRIDAGRSRLVEGRSPPIGPGAFRSPRSGAVKCTASEAAPNPFTNARAPGRSGPASARTRPLARRHPVAANPEGARRRGAVVARRTSKPAPTNTLTS